MEVDPSVSMTAGDRYANNSPSVLPSAGGAATGPAGLIIIIPKPEIQGPFVHQGPPRRSHWCCLRGHGGVQGINGQKTTFATRLTGSPYFFFCLHNWKHAKVKKKKEISFFKIHKELDKKEAKIVTNLNSGSDMSVLFF